MYNNHTTSITVVSIYVFPRPIIGIQNLDFHQFSNNKRVIHSEKRLLKKGYMLDKIL